MILRWFFSPPHNSLFGKKKNPNKTLISMSMWLVMWSLIHGWVTVSQVELNACMSRKCIRWEGESRYNLVRCESQGKWDGGESFTLLRTLGLRLKAPREFNALVKEKERSFQMDDNMLVTTSLFEKEIGRGKEKAIDAFTFCKLVRGRWWCLNGSSPYNILPTIWWVPHLGVRIPWVVYYMLLMREIVDSPWGNLVMIWTVKIDCQPLW